MSRAIVVTSHSNNAVALDHFLEHVSKCERFGECDILLVIGGCRGTDYRITDRGSRVYSIESPYNSIDYSGLLALLDLGFLDRAYDSVFYVHDTTRPGPSFLRRVLEIPESYSTASFMWPSMNIGIYSRTILETHKALIDSFRNADSSLEAAQRLKIKCVHSEDCIFRANAEHHQFLTHGPPKVEGPLDYYGHGTPRIVEYYDAVDLYKIKANWYIKNEYQLRI